VGPEPPHAPQTKAPGLRGARPSSVRNWCSFCAKLPMASAPSGSTKGGEIRKPMGVDWWSGGGGVGDVAVMAVLVGL
jgi:hypothetical protein